MAGNPDDQVPRLRGWRAAHPDWTIRPPSTGDSMWEAQPPENGDTVRRTELAELLDALDDLLDGGKLT